MLTNQFIVMALMLFITCFNWLHANLEILNL